MTKEEKKVPVTHLPWRTPLQVCNFKAEVNSKCTCVEFVIQLQVFCVGEGGSFFNCVLNQFINIQVV